VDLWKIVKDLLHRRGNKDTAWLSRKTKIKDRTIYAWMENNRLPRIDDAYKIAKSLDVSLDYLMTGKELEYTSDDPLLSEICKYIANLSHDERVELMGMLKHVRYLSLMPDKLKKKASSD